ncbi:membrane protein insertase YidC [Candidatus Liberibacter sp.]|uniref:membrane protein insertase YidC n=1 Tax=Candidatus Liberibacter sp. TaxID=34022 RepID=UPI0015F6557D|nr:membrane protein insertase YidC [Candidatus Liberibacter sp.]MBA5724137.1 membrane protein insertase YidC [Candidatus Liberibacter sp.]
MEERNRNYFAAIVLSVAIIFMWQFLYVNPRIEAMRQEKKALESVKNSSDQNDVIPSITSPPFFIDNRELALARSPRVEIDTPSLIGSINLKGARFDDLNLKKYHVDASHSSPIVKLLNPSNTRNAYFTEMGYLSAYDIGEVPGSDTVWKLVSGEKLTTSTPIKLAFMNAKNVLFERVIALDEHYMFTITDTVTNNSIDPISFALYGRITRYKTQEEEINSGSHDGLIAILGNQSLVEKKYSDIEKSTISNASTSNGWLGITNKYWASVFIPPKDLAFESRFSFFAHGKPRYQADFKGNETVLMAGKSSKTTSLLFAGAKEVPLLKNYEKELTIPRFEMLIDWGWFYFVAKPMFSLMHYFHNLVGNFGLAILLTTVVVKLLFFPFARKQYISTANMQNIQPQIDKLREKFKDDTPQALQKATLDLYKKNNINPLAGCLPILMQIPVFFAIYKVISISIEMRHAPFIGWISDLSSRDPSNIFNLFGALPFTPLEFMHIGAWPIIMSLSMFIQMKMSPPPADRGQAIIMSCMPIFFVFALASFPAGLVIYWAWSNVISIIQQAIIMKLHGAKIGIIDKLCAIFNRRRSSPNK